MKSTKFYKVLLPKGHKAQKDQIVDGYLGNTFGNGIGEEFTRGEAIKKARTFGGKIELAREIRYMFINIETRDGEKEYNSKDAISFDADIELKKCAEDYTKEVFGDKNPEGNGWYWDESFETMCRLHSYNETTKQEYDILKKYI